MEQESLEAGYLLIEDEIFSGKILGAPLTQPVFGEVVFNTSMTGYQEILTDPSYAGQIVCFTTAHVGNYGTNLEDNEWLQISAQAALIHEVPQRPSNFRSEASLDAFLKKHKKSALVGIDTRAVTLYLRHRGVTPGVIFSESMKGTLAELKKQQKNTDYASIDWIKKTTTREIYQFPLQQPKKFKVIAYDYGAKARMFKELADRGCEITVVPADYPAEKVLEEKPDGVFLSNGPGDPSLATYAVKNVKALLGELPIFGVCMGHQVLAMALGAKTYKLKFGHRGGNQPVRHLDPESQSSHTSSSVVEISSHNHGYAVDEKTLPPEVVVTHKNLNDQCLEGIKIPSLSAFSVQYHPESSPGPHDSGYLFDDFVDLMSRFKK